MTDILDLPGWSVIGTRLDGNEYELEVECSTEPEGVAKAVNRAGRGYSFDVLRARILFRTPGRKAPPGSRYYPVVPHNGPGSAAPSMAVKCMSCGGMYDKRIVAPGHLLPITGRERIRNFAMLCRPCNKRFHTE